MAGLLLFMQHTTSNCDLNSKINYLNINKYVKTKIKKTFTLYYLYLVPRINASALPGNISELVEESAPAVVNITAKKEMLLQDLPLDTVEFLMKCLKGLEFPENFEICRNKKEKRFLMDLDLFLKIIIL